MSRRILWSSRIGKGARLTAASLAVVASLGIAACTSPRNALGPNESPCFRVLAVARAAVNDTGHFAGVRYLSSRDLTAALRDMKTSPRLRFTIPAALQRQRSAVCAVAYWGASRRAAWRSAGRRTGTTIRSRSSSCAVRDVRVLVTFVLSKPPLRFTRFLPPLA